MLRILFLGYDRSQTSLLEFLVKQGHTVDHSADKIHEPPKADVGISFGYRHILKKPALEGCPIVNLHIGYLPYNRGAHPNYWSHAEGTPPGVTIHLIDEGIDTGPILYQNTVAFTPDEDTYRKTQDRLLREIETLFIRHASDIVTGNYEPRPQVGSGTYHRMADLPNDFPGWDSKIPQRVMI